MDRQTFFDAQLWLRRVDEGELSWPDKSQQPCPGVTQLLPPLDRASNMARAVSQSQPVSQPTEAAPLTCSGSFHSASRICYFRPTDVNEDQTLLGVELIVVEPQDAAKPASLFVRLDHNRVYEMAVSAIQSVIIPERPRTTVSNYLPPFGSLDFGSVTLRLWLEPHDTPVAEARAYLADALRKVEKLRSQYRAYDLLKEDSHNPWGDCFRHNRWVARRQNKAVSEKCEEPAELLRRDQEIFTSDADKEALKMVITNFKQKIGHNARSTGLTDIREDAEMVHTQPAHDHDQLGGALTEQQRFELVASLVHVFGEDHPGLRQLLGSCAAEECRAHQGCSRLSTDGSLCLMQKWQRWDDFLQLSSDAVGQPNKRQRISSTPQNDTDVGNAEYLQAAGSAFVGAVISPEDDGHLSSLHRAATKRLASLEAAAFGALFPIQTKALTKFGTPAKNPAQHTAEPLTPVTPQRGQVAPRQPTTPQTPQNLAHSKAEHTWNFLLESRRALVRQELTLACLPRRDHHHVVKK